MIDVNPGERPKTPYERIDELERENIELMLALTQVYEELLALQTGGTQ